MYSRMKVRKIIDIDLPGLGQRIKDARENNPQTLAALCRSIGMTPMNWYRIESEETKALPIETLRDIERALNVDFGVNFEEVRGDIENDN